MTGLALPLALRAYLALSRGLGPLAQGLDRRRLVRAGVAEHRLAEREGYATAPRPAGRLIWIHAASVGELASVLDLAGDLVAQGGVAVLLTTGTATSARLAAARAPAGAIHQFAPLDRPGAVARFLDHWRPDLAAFVESDLWPRLVLATAARGVPLVLLNARASGGRRRAPGLARALLAPFAAITAQDTGTAAELAALGLDLARITVTGDLKSAAAPLAADPAALAALRAAIGGRPVWVAASTHAGEEAAVIVAQAAVLAVQPDTLLILVPRHPERGAEVWALIAAAGLRGAQRSAGALPDAATQVYLADTLGEMGLFYRAAPLVFLGGSLVAGPGGHNPYEPARLGAAVLHGPHIANARPAHAALAAAGAARQVSDGADLGRQVAAFLAGAEPLAPLTEAARAVMEGRDEIRARVCRLLLDVLGGVDSGPPAG